MSWLSGWQYRKSHNINGSSVGAVENYQVRITVHYGSGTDNGEHVYLNGKCRTDFGDIRFTKSDGITELYYWMEKKVDGDYAVFWVKIPSIPASPNSVTIYIYYGKDDAVTTSNGLATWIYFDDFEGDSPLDNYTADIGSKSDFEVVTFDGSKRLHYKGAVAWYLLSRNGSDISDIRLLVKIYPEVGSSSNYYVGVVWREVDNSKFYFGWLANDNSGYADSPSGTRMDWLKRVNGSDTYIDGGSTNHAGSAWHDIEILMYGSNAKGYYDGTEKFNATDTAISASGKVGFIGLHHAYWDDFCVGKYVEPEPTHDIWGSEESFSTGFVPLFTPEDVSTTTDTSIIDNELVTYETPQETITSLFTPEDTNSTTDTSIVDNELVTYEEPLPTLTVVVTNESVTPNSAFVGDTVTYSAIVKDENGNPLPEEFVADLLLDDIVVIDNQQFNNEVYDSSTGELTLEFTVPDTSPGTKVVKLKWEEQII